MKKSVRNFILIVLLFACILLVIFLFGNHYNMNEKRISIPTNDGKLSAIMTVPKSNKVIGIIIFVQGDGAQNATQDDGYKPLMERFANQGFVTISWDKLGVGKSEGNWLTQSMDDRSDEVIQVIDWVEAHYPDYSKKIGLWGASQAGWVIPKVIDVDKRVQFSILVGPAINWLRQGEYDTGNQVIAEGGTVKEVGEAKKNFIKDSLLIKENPDYTSYKNNGGKETMSSDRYLFIRENMSQDVTQDLSTIKSKLYLILAENDKNVDSSETKKVYQSVVPKEYLSIYKIPNVEHQMINPTIDSSSILINLTAIFLPKYYLIDDNYLDCCEKIVKSF